MKARITKALAVVAAMGLIAGVAPSAHAAASTIQLYISADTNIKDLWEKTLIPEFNKAYPDYTVNVTFDRNGTNDAQTLAKITASKVTRRDPGIDLIDGGIVTQLGSAGLLYRPTGGLLPNIKKVPTILVKNGNGGIPYRASTVLLAYNSKNVSNPPKTYAALMSWIKANPGKFTYNAPAGGGSGRSFVQTVLDSSLSKADITALQTGANKAVQAKWAAGWATLRGLNKYTYGQNGTYPANNAATLDLLAKGLVDMGPVWSDQIASALKAGTMPKDIKVVGISNPSFTGGPAYLGIPANSTNRNGARLLANWVLSPAAQNLIVSGSMNGLPVIPQSLLDASVAALIADLDITAMRAPYLSANDSDMKAAWALEVPGK
jgi:putative spermidine/putrescine transport system substrate-binding protein